MKSAFSLLLFQSNSLDGEAFFRFGVDRKDRTVCLHRTVIGLASHGKCGKITLDDDVGFHTDDAARCTAHTDIGDITRSLGKHLLIGGGDVGMRTEDRCKPSVKIPRERELLPRCLCVKIQNGKVVFSVFTA